MDGAGKRNVIDRLMGDEDTPGSAPKVARAGDGGVAPHLPIQSLGSIGAASSGGPISTDGVTIGVDKLQEKMLEF